MHHKSKKIRIYRYSTIAVITLVVLSFQNCTSAKLGTPNSLSQPSTSSAASCAADPGAGQTTPLLPQTFDTSYVEPTGAMIFAATTADFQNALKNVKFGDTIVLTAGNVYTGPFVLPVPNPNPNPNSGWVYIRSSNYAFLPAPGNRVSPANSNNMPKIIAPSLLSAINTADKANHYRFVGIDFAPASGQYTFNVIQIGNGRQAEYDSKGKWTGRYLKDPVTGETLGDDTPDTLPSYITFDRCYIHGDADPNNLRGTRRGIIMNGPYVAVVDSYLSEFKDRDSDSQAIYTSNSPGPLKIVNNYLEAASENVMPGGGDPDIAGLIPADIEIRHNYFFKPLKWLNQSWNVKNLLEFKNGQRILVEGNTFENNWLAGGQNGYSILITPRNQDNTAPCSATRDITIRLNKIINVGGGINISGQDDGSNWGNGGGGPTQLTKRVLIENNILQVSRLSGPVGQSIGNLFQVLNGIQNLTINHNTGFINSASTLTSEDVGYKVQDFTFTNNIVGHGTYGILGQGKCCGTSVLNYFYNNWIFSKNAIYGFAGTGDNSANYPIGSFYPADLSSVRFMNYVDTGNAKSDFINSDYHLTTSVAAPNPLKNAGTDGKDLGADIDAVNAATQ